MGERASIKVTHYDDGHIWLYSHWGGHEIVETLAEGLARAKSAGRLTDPSYATRIIFDTLTGCRGDDLGFGIHIGGDEPDSNYDNPHVLWAGAWGSEPSIIYRDWIMSVDTFLERYAVLTA